MTREELKRHCLNQIESCERWARLSGQEPYGKIYEEHKLILELLEQEPKTGHWIAQDIHNCHTDFKCSARGYIHSFMHIYGEPTADYTYCPNCGTKMVESQENEVKE